MVSIGAGEIQDLGNIETLQRDLDRLCVRMRSKGAPLGDPEQIFPIIGFPLTNEWRALYGSR